MPKGKKRVRGEPVDHNELKKSLNLTVTPTGARGLEEIAQELGLKSKSELVDQIGRRRLIVSPNPVIEKDTEE
ncbi:MAG: hypothetical protein RID53_01370 [Coleofasciculus sp. B1-GNL1-01]|uniref:hypothetical protein n=1 Tax=Coleofasciculus sp. B1-GNL1-01 TaxID=3068484 RepID=UPI0032FFCE01